VLPLSGLPWVKGSPWGYPWVWVWVWGGYGDRNSVPTAALDSAVGMGIPMGMGIGWVWDINYVPTAALAIIPNKSVNKAVGARTVITNCGRRFQ